MTAPSPRTGTTATADWATAITVAKPSGLSDGDVLFLFVAYRDDPGTVTPPAGFTGALITTGTPEEHLYRCWKHITNAASEPADYTVNSTTADNRMTACAMPVVGADTSTPIDAEGFTNDPGYDSTLNLAGIITNTDNCLLVLWYNTIHWVTITGPGTQYAEAAQEGVGEDVRSEWETQTQATAGPTGDKTATLSGKSRGTSAIFAIKPPAGASNQASGGVVMPTPVLDGDAKALVRGSGSVDMPIPVLGGDAKAIIRGSGGVVAPPIVLDGDVKAIVKASGGVDTSVILEGTTGFEALKRFSWIWQIGSEIKTIRKN